MSDKVFSEGRKICWLQVGTCSHYARDIFFLSGKFILLVLLEGGKSWLLIMFRVFRSKQEGEIFLLPSLIGSSRYLANHLEFPLVLSMNKSGCTSKAASGHLKLASLSEN